MLIVMKCAIHFTTATIVVALQGGLRSVPYREDARTVIPSLVRSYVGFDEAIATDEMAATDEEFWLDVDEYILEGLDLDWPQYTIKYIASTHDRNLETPWHGINDEHDCAHGWDITNPSFILKQQKEVWAVFRATCVALAHPRKRWYSKLVFGRATPDGLRRANASWTWSEFHEAKDPRFFNASPKKQECLLPDKDFSQGPEDPKLLAVNNKTYVIVTGLDTMIAESAPTSEDDRPNCEENKLHGFLLHAYELKSVRPFTYGAGVKLTFEGMDLVEKNWNFFVHQKWHGMEEMLAVYSVNPHTIMRVNLTTGQATKIHEVHSPLLKSMAEGLAMSPDDLHLGAGVARINETALPGAIVSEPFPHHCLMAVGTDCESKVLLRKCNRSSPLSQWKVPRYGEQGQIHFAGRHGMCLDSMNGTLLLNWCQMDRMEQRFSVPPSKSFGKFQHTATGRCIHFEYEEADVAKGNLSVQPCDWLETHNKTVPETLRLKHSFSFLGREERRYYLSLFHSTNIGTSVPYRNFPYRFSTEPPFKILEIGSEITAHLKTGLNPAHHSPVQFVTNVMYDKAHSNLGNVVLGYGSGDTEPRIFKMDLRDFENNFFGVNNASFTPDPLHGLPAIIQQKRDALIEQRKAAKREREEAEAARLAASAVAEHGEGQEASGTSAAEAGANAKELAARNLCSGGQIIPELFILGGQVNFSSSLVRDLRRSPEMAFDAPGPEGGPTGEEALQAVPGAGNFLRGQQASNENVNGLSTLGTIQWRGGYPACLPDQRQVVAETSVALLSREDGAQAVASLVGSTPFMSRVQFVVLLRDPGRRLQAAYRMHFEMGDCAGELPDTLQGALDALVHTGNVCNCRCDVIVPKNLDGKALSEYFKTFDSKQFEVVPFKFTVSASFPRYVWDLMGVQHGELPETPALGNRFRTLIPMQDFVQEETIRQLDAYFESRTGDFKLHEVLAKSDAKLFEYHGQAHDSAGIAAWLADGLQEDSGEAIVQGIPVPR